MRLVDLFPGDEFEYVKTTRIYRQGRFIVLDYKRGSCLESIAKENCVFIFSFTTNKICNHFGYNEVNLISKAKESNMENKMGHFINWKFGVPVKVCYGSKSDDSARLVSETSSKFVVVWDDGHFSTHRKSDGYTYELIPYKSPIANILRYPVCENSTYMVYCNAVNTMKSFDVAGGEYKLIRFPTATLTIDGKTVELSAETVNNLRKELGI